jgi:hypothetical protein
MTPTDELLAALAAFDAAHRAAEEANHGHYLLRTEYDAIKSDIEANIAADKRFTNDTLRKAESARQLEAEPHTATIRGAEAAKRAADATLARAEQALKTHRALVNHYTAELTLEAARIQASIAATAPISGSFYGDDLPF